MAKNGLNISLTSYDDIFKSEAHSGSDEITQIPLSELKPFEEQPFKVHLDESMDELVESVREYGVLSPIIARPHPDGGYEILSGHRRAKACELAGITGVPVMIKDLDDDSATILKSTSDMIEICKNNAGFEVSNAYTSASYYKISTEKNTYFLCCMPELQECNFNIYCYENKQLERLKDVIFADKTYGNIEADKFFKSSDGFTEMFYNPDANAGGQVVINEISNALIKEAAQFKTSDAFFEHINDGCRQSLIDAGTPAFRRTVKELVESKADLEGINKDTMKGLLKAAGIKPKNKENER